MSIKTDVLWTMASRYQKAALDTDDLDQAERYTIKACQFQEMWEKAVDGIINFDESDIERIKEEAA